LGQKVIAKVGSPSGIPQSVRDQFPGTQHWAYFDVAARGLLPVPSREAVDRYFDSLSMYGGDKAEMFQVVESARAKFARLIGTEADEIAITKNVSEGINIVATAYPWKSGDKVILCAEREHPNNIYIWQHLAHRYGIEVVVVPSRGDLIVAEDLIGKIDARTRMVSVSSVSFHPGLKTDIDALGEACTAKDVLLLVDGVQSVGVSHVDVSRTKMDALVVSTQKGLLGLYGLGFLYVRRAWAERLEPAYLARFGVDLGDAHEADGGISAYKLMGGARRFDLGNYNFTGATAVDRSLDLILDLGTEAIERHVRALTQRMVEGFVEAGLPVVGAPYGGHFANMVTVSPKADDADFNVRLEQALAGEKVKLSIRRNALRFSSHCYNTAEEVDAVVDAVRRFLRLNSKTQARSSSAPN
jgi:selenocysteine lyase/cysteine desulfurase